MSKTVDEARARRMLRDGVYRASQYVLDGELWRLWRPLFEERWGPLVVAYTTPLEPVPDWPLYSYVVFDPCLDDGGMVYVYDKDEHY